MIDSPATPPGPVLWEDLIPAGCHWSGVIRRGVTLRLTDLEGGANCSALLYNFEENDRALQHARHAQGPAHRVPHRAATCATPTWAACCARSPPTPPAGTTPSAACPTTRCMREHYGVKRFQEHRNAMHRSGRKGC